MYIVFHFHPILAKNGNNFTFCQCRIEMVEIVYKLDIQNVQIDFFSSAFLAMGSG